MFLFSGTERPPTVSRDPRDLYSLGHDFANAAIASSRVASSQRVVVGFCVRPMSTSIGDVLVGDRKIRHRDTSAATGQQRAQNPGGARDLNGSNCAPGREAQQKSAFV